MLHDGNKILGHPRSEESIKLLTAHLVHIHEDGDGDSLFVRFSELLARVKDQEMQAGVTWNMYLKALGANKTPP